MAKMHLPSRDRASVSQSINAGSIDELLFGPSLIIDESCKPSGDACRNILHIYLKSTSVSGRCPCCGAVSSAVNCAAFRHPRWMPVNGMTTYAHIILKRYFCKNPGCIRRTFVEGPDNVRSGQHRSDLVNLVVFAISVFCSDIVTAMICREMGISISHDSANRMLEKISVEDDRDAAFIGVDDVSLRKGQTYHTVIYDGSDHHLPALLDGRDGEALKEWLKEHPKVSVVARGRASAYASAISEILPGAVQVTDRFHILQNLMGYLNDIFKADIPPQIFIRDGEVLNAPEKEPVPEIPMSAGAFNGIDYGNSPSVDERGNIIPYFNKQCGDHRARDKKRAAGRLKRYEWIMQMRKDWDDGKYDSKSSLAQVYGMSVANARRYLSMPDEEVAKMLPGSDLPNEEAFDVRVTGHLTGSQSKKKYPHPELADQYRHICRKAAFDCFPEEGYGEYEISLCVLRFSVGNGTCENIITNLPKMNSIWMKSEKYITSGGGLKLHSAH